MASSVLSPFSSGTFNQTFLLARMQQQFQARITSASNGITADYQAKMNRNDLDSEKWTKLQVDLEAGRGVLSGVLGRAKRIRNLLDQLLIITNKAKLDPETASNSSGYKSTFDALLRTIRGEAENSTDNPNLLGTDEVVRHSYPTTTTGSTQTVYGNYLGADYYITDTDGKRWVPDRDSKVLWRYESYDDERSDISGNLVDGVTLSTISGDDVTFTVPGTDGTPVTYTGTLTRTGLGVLDGWAYDDLATEAGRELAITDLEAAKEAVDLEISRYDVARDTALFYESRVDLVLSDFKTENNEYMIAQLEELTKSKGEYQRQMDLISSSLANSFAIRGAYANMFSPPDLLPNYKKPVFIDIFS